MAPDGAFTEERLQFHKRREILVGITPTNTKEGKQLEFI